MTKARELSDYTGLQGDLALKSTVASPVFTGNVGVGVTPETDWHSGKEAIQLGVGASIYGDTTATGNQISANARSTLGSTLNGYKYISTDKASTYHQYDGAHNFRVAASGTADAAISWTTAMTIDNSGNVSIGSPASTDKRLNVKGPVNEHIAIFQTATDGYAVLFRNSANTNVGSIAVNASSTTYATSSDYRLKENVTPMSGATAQTKLLKPCNFDWIAGGNVNGFLAHELAEVVPEAVTGTKDAMRDEEYEVTPAVLDDEGVETTAAVMGTRSVPDMQGIDQSKLVPLLTATIQELIARIEALEGAAP